MTVADEAAAFCAQEVRSRDFDSYAVSLFAPPEQRRALLALAAFNLEIARVRDMVSQPLPGEIRLQWWIDALAGKEHGEVAGNPVAAELLQVRADHALPDGSLQQMIEAHRFDLYDDPMPSLAALERYGQHTDGTLAALGARILGANDDTTAKAAQLLGAALGVARTIRLLPLHASRRQLYLPADLISRHGVDVESVFAGRTTPELVALLADMRGVARAHLEEAMRLVATVPRTARSIFLPLALARHGLETPPPDPFRIAERSRLRTLWTMWRTKF